LSANGCLLAGLQLQTSSRARIVSDNLRTLLLHLLAALTLASSAWSVRQCEGNSDGLLCKERAYRYRAAMSSSL
jgi:hypothetical protein